MDMYILYAPLISEGHENNGATYPVDTNIRIEVKLSTNSACPPKNVMPN